MADRQTRTGKRRLAQALFDADDMTENPRGDDPDLDPDENVAQDDDGDAANANVRSEKEQEIWDAFKEEQFEVLEQLPLSLHRSFTLMNELDQQVHAHESQILPSLQQYIRLRQIIAIGGNGTEGLATSKDDAPSTSTPEITDVQMAEVESLSNNFRIQSLGDDKPRSLRSTSGSPRKKTGSISSPTKAAGQVPPEPAPQSTRALLVKVAQLSEEVVRASNEKVNVARHACDLVDRYIRDLERAIKEQETSISLGLRPGTHPALIILPEVVVPKPTRTRAALSRSPSPMNMDIPEITTAAPALVDPDAPTLGTVSAEPALEKEGPPARVAPRKRKGAGRSKKKITVKTTPSMQEALNSESTQPPASPLKIRSVKLNVKPLVPVPAVPNVSEVPLESDPNEKRYCFCNQVSFGTMVACDNKGCKREWFHLGCVGLEDEPDDDEKWYCRECEKKMGRSTRRKARA